LFKPRRSQRIRERRQAPSGAYLGYLNTKYDCPEMVSVLNRIGCFSHIDEKNYVSNCLCLAMEDAGVSPEVIVHLKTSCLRRTIPRRCIKQIAEQHKLRVSIQTFKDNRIIHVGPEDGFKVKLACFMNHYFHIFPTKINSWAVKNYDQVKDKPFWYEFRKQCTRNKNGGMDSFKLLKLLMELNTLESIDSSTLGAFSTQFHDKVARTFKTLDYPKSAVHLKHSPRFGENSPEDFKEYDRSIGKLKASYFATEYGQASWTRLQNKFKDKGMGLKEQLQTLQKNVPHVAEFFVDFETSTDGGANERKIHRPYLVSFMENREDEIRTVIGPTCGLQLLDYIADTYGVSDGDVPTVQLKAHNMTYDASFFLQFLEQLRLIERGVNIICGKGLFKTQRYDEELKVYISLQDTQKIIIGPLARFSSMFQLEHIKEVMPYDLYTEEFIDEQDGIADISDLNGFAQFDELMCNLEAWGCEVAEGQYDMIKYGRIYCEADVRLLAEGWRIFQKDTLEHTGIDANYVPTAASLAHAFIMESGSYDGVYEISGAPREFVQLCIRGGRVCCAENKIHKFTSNDPALSDLDAVSLYPSAMYFMDGYPKGPPKVWNEMIELDSVDDAFLAIEVINVGKQWKIPIFSIRTKEGNEWTDDLIGQMIHVDKYTLEQMQEHLSSDEEPFRYRIIQGYYFDEGFNTGISSTIKHLFDKRVLLKQQGSPAQEGIKLLMNTAFGMTGRKADMTDIKYVEDKEITNYIHNHHNEIKILTRMPNSTWRVEIWKSINDHFNMAHLACRILSYSKKLMNDVVCMVEKHCGTNVLYTDTDSMHLPADVIPLLRQKYSEVFNRELIGNSLGQFHSDFSFDGAYTRENRKLVPCSFKAVGQIESKASYLIWKKSYIDEIEDEAGNRAWHIRLKGVPMKCIVNKVNEEYEGDPMKMYEDFYQGSTVEFKLGCGGHVMFKTNKNHSIETVQMIRKICFKNGRN